MRIIVHFGLQKTGSTSIQATLAKNAANIVNIYYLQNREDQRNLNYALSTAFSQKPCIIHRLKNISAKQFSTRKTQRLLKLDESFRLHQGRDVLISSEAINQMNADEIQAIYSWLRTYSEDIIAVAYVRSPMTYLASAFQQQIKGGNKKALDLGSSYPYYRYKIEKFDQIFGKDKVFLWKFDPSNFPEGGVVADFCQRLNINILKEAFVRVNEGLSQAAVSLLFAYSKYGHGIGRGKQVKAEINLLVNAVMQLPGNKLQFSEKLIQQTLKAHSDDIAWIEARLGSRLLEKIPSSENDIHSEEDLLKFAPETLAWLATQLGGAYQNQWHLQMTAQEVAEWMHLLRLKLAAEEIVAPLAEKPVMNQEKKQLLREPENAQLAEKPVMNQEKRRLLRESENTQLAEKPVMNQEKKQLLRELEQQLNATVSNFQYHFQILNDKSELRIENFPPLYFPHQEEADGIFLGGCSGWVKQKHKNGRIHEPSMVAALLVLQKHLPAPVFFDIGALYGYFSLVVHSLFADAQVCAFEMNPLSFVSLEKNILANQIAGENRLRCVNVGLSDKTQLQHKSRIEKFKLYEKCSDEEGIALDVLKLDDFCAQNNLQPTLMKIDVEGYQAKIIPGAMATIAQCKPTILLEFDTPNTLRQFGCTNKEIVQPLFDLGYSLFWCETQRRATSYFQQLSYADLSAKHEKNSLALFVQL